MSNKKRLEAIKSIIPGKSPFEIALAAAESSAEGISIDKESFAKYLYQKLIDSNIIETTPDDCSFTKDNVLKTFYSTVNIDSSLRIEEQLKQKRHALINAISKMAEAHSATFDSELYKKLKDRTLNEKFENYAIASLENIFFTYALAGGDSKAIEDYNIQLSSGVFTACDNGYLENLSIISGRISPESAAYKYKKLALEALAMEFLGSRDLGLKIFTGERAKPIWEIHNFTSLLCTISSEYNLPEYNLSSLSDESTIDTRYIRDLSDDYEHYIMWTSFVENKLESKLLEAFPVPKIDITPSAKPVDISIVTPALDTKKSPSFLEISKSDGEETVPVTYNPNGEDALNIKVNNKLLAKFR